MYCPNCQASVESSALCCRQCKADFGPQSAWRPLSTKPTSERISEPFFSKLPKPIHAMQAVALFALAGPVFGLFTLAFISDDVRTAKMMLNLLGLMGAFALGGGPAMFAGGVYCVLSLFCLFMFPRYVMSIVMSGILGCVAGLTGAFGFFQLFFPETPAENFVQLICLSATVGLMCGVLSGWLLPVGKTPATP